MTETIKDVSWESAAKTKYDLMISKIPIFHREIARQVVEKQAVINARKRGAAQVEEIDIVRAFLTDVPKAFYSLMIRIMDQVGFNYQEI